MRRVFTRFAVGFAALAFASTAQAAWVLHQSAEHGFQAMFPKAPKSETSTDQGVTLQSFAGANDGAMCIVMIGQYPYLIDPNVELPASQNNFVKGVEASLTSTKRVTFTRGTKQLQAVQFEAESATHLFRSLIVIEDARAYQVVGGIKKPDVDDAELNACVSGFSLTPRT